MFLGVFLFAVVAVICVVAGGVAMKRRRDYGNSDGGEDDDFDFDFDKYEGFDKE